MFLKVEHTSNYNRQIERNKMRRNQRVYRDRKEINFELQLSCVKLMLFLLNAVFVISSVLTISGGLSTIFGLYSYNHLMDGGFQMLSQVCLAVGIVFLLVSLFGIFVAFKEYTLLANLYGIAMIVVLILQILSAVVAFSLIYKSRYMVSALLDSMMNDYRSYRLEVDWIQSKVIGIALGLMYARMIRHRKTQQDIQIWNSCDRSSAVY